MICALYFVTSDSTVVLQFIRQWNEKKEIGEILAWLADSKSEEVLKR